MPTPQELADILKQLISGGQPPPPPMDPNAPLTSNPVMSTPDNPGPPVPPPMPWEPNFPASAAPVQQPQQAVADPNQWLKDAIMSKTGNPMNQRVDALNRNFNSQGITASKDDKGHLVLTGVGTVPLAGTGQDVVAGNVRGIIEQLRKTTDIDTARGLQAQLNEAAAQETARIQGEARTHAENKLGVPGLESNLSSMIELDRNSPSYYPGRGDSQNTAAARQALNTARGAADLEVQRMLKSNVSANGLDAALKTASMETQRISRLADRKDMLDTQVAAATLAKKDAINERLDQQAEGLSDQTQQAIRTLNPALANGSLRDLAANFMKEGRANPNYLAAITAPPTELPLLATTGNDHARALINAQEGALGIRPVETDAKLRQMQDIMRSPSKLQEALKLITPQGADADKSIKSVMADMAAKSTGTKEEKAQALSYKYELAKQVVAQTITHGYMSDVNNWGSPDPGLAAAVLQAKTVAGKTDITEVANAYIGAAQGAAANQRMEQLISIMTQQASASKGSLFGMPDTMVLRNKIMADQLARTRAARLDAMPFSGNSLGIYN